MNQRILEEALSLAGAFNSSLSFPALISPMQIEKDKTAIQMSSGSNPSGLSPSVEPMSASQVGDQSTSVRYGKACSITFASWYACLLQS
jgi:hypothetical protein